MDSDTRFATVRPESSAPTRVGRQWWPDPSKRVPQAVRITANVIGAAGAGYFSYVTLEAYLRTHRPIGFLFFAEQMVVVVAYLVRRPAHTVTARLGDWLLAFGGTFLPVLLRPDGAHPQWGLQWGLVLQFCGVVVCLWSFFALGRSFGFAAADRGLVATRPLPGRAPSDLRVIRVAPDRVSAPELLVAQPRRGAARRRVQRRPDTGRRACARHERRARRVPPTRPVEGCAGTLVSQPGAPARAPTGLSRPLSPGPVTFGPDMRAAARPTLVRAHGP